MASVVVGAKQFRDFARDLRKTSKGMYREMVKSMRTEAKPLVQEIKDSALQIQSDGARGGASARASRAEFLLRRHKAPSERARLMAHRKSGLRAATSRTVQFAVRTSGRGAGIRIKSNSAMMPAGQQKLPDYLNRGRWRHPVFNDRTTWVVQTVSPGWFDKPVKRDGPKARDRVIDTVKEYITKGFEG